MTQSGKLINGGLALILISSSGCAGNGLRNMFSRNETAGYKTLEELEEERIAKENSDEESGPRFASWLPFGKKTADETEAIADAGETADVAEDSKKSGWWKNPFRRQETIESDPFLENELPTEVVVAGKNTAKAKAKEATETASAVKAETAKDIAAVKDKAVKTVSATTESAVTEEDDLLVEKFEKHFQQATETAVSNAEEGSDVIVAGIEGAAAGAAASKKKAASSAENVNTAADKKLAEFEELLAAKKAAASKTRKEVNLDEEFETVEGTADEFAESLSETTKSATKQTRTIGKQAVASVDEFDSLFETIEKPATPKKKKTASTRPSSASKSADEVKVADADDIFGAEAVSGNGSSRQTKKSASAGGWKGGDSEADVASADRSGKVGSRQDSDLARKVIDNTVDQFASMFSGSRNSGGAPAATAPDADEWTTAAQGKTGGSKNRGVPVRTASNGRELGAALENPAGLKDDKFFAGGSDAPLVTNLQAVPSAELNQVSAPAAPMVRENENTEATSPAVRVPSTFSVRNIVLIIGGIIVAALLFAPGRKKPTVANQLPAQG